MTNDNGPKELIPIPRFDSIANLLIQREHWRKIKVNWVESMKKIRLLAIGLVLTVVAVGYFLPPRLMGQAPAHDASSVLPLLGTDDGFACALFYGSDIDGSLEPCG
jgi:hypothetical protein